MVRLVRVWMLLLGLSACPSAPSHGVPVYTPAEPDETDGPLPIERGPVEQPFLYQVEANVPSLILGTTNAGVALADTTIDGHALNNVRVVVVDMRIDEMTPRDLQRARMRNDSLETWIGTVAWRDLIEELLGVTTPDDLRAMRPWYAYGVLVGHRTRQIFEGDVPEPMSYSLTGLADEAGIPVRALETPAERVTAMNAIPNDLLGEVLAHVIEHPTRHELHLRALCYKYRAGDEDALLAQLMTGLELETSREVYERFYLRRFEGWLPVLREELDAGNAFIALDIGHLLGPQGMLETLRGLGYSIERVE